VGRDVALANRAADLDRIIRAVIARLDSTFRADYGVRLEQVADTSEFWTSALQSAEWYRHADKRYRHVGIYSHLYSGLEGLLRKRARRIVNKRAPEELKHETPES
jgi:hypothetical protein